MFGDFCTGTVSALRLVPGGRRVYVISAADIEGLSSFGQDQRGELYAMSLAGVVYKLIP